MVKQGRVRGDDICLVVPTNTLHQGCAQTRSEAYVKETILQGQNMFVTHTTEHVSNRTVEISIALDIQSDMRCHQQVNEWIKMNEILHRSLESPGLQVIAARWRGKLCMWTPPMAKTCVTHTGGNLARVLVNVCGRRRMQHRNSVALGSAAKVGYGSGCGHRIGSDDELTAKFSPDSV